MNKLEFVRFRGLDYACKEAINTLCTNLTFVGSDKRVIMVTSTTAHEGKSFLSMNIMRTLAQLGKKVVLVDADLRKSQIAGKYGVRVQEGNGYGTTHYLAGMCSLNDVVYETNIPGAYMIPVGREVTNSLALLSTPRLKHMVKELQERFDFVLMDAPPVGVIIDAAEIAKSCHGAIFSVKYNTISRRELLDAKARIDRTGCEVLGAVLNEVDLEALSSKKYYNKSYYNHYNSDYYKPSEDHRKSVRRTSSRK
ncbi:MAG: CpsD/CapB family tyrosine-protein kinase [Clostridia bacterium]|nr:CpsD/CapB family tyrosine-protein kinase [Clostridia bacterium]MBP3652514.1 CpsD/CapB family tyrosine-protein kinase [Clostridia bacterium]